jgi:hypothetical protein
VNWKLTQSAIGEPEVDMFRDDPDEDLAAGYTMLRALAEAGESAREIAPGVHLFEKPEPGKWI